MSGQGIFQIVVYTVVLVALAYPLGIYMARVYAGGFATRGRLRFLGVPERGFYRLLGVDPERDQDWKGYAKAVLIFSAVFSIVLYALLRLQGHLFLNPDELKGVPSHISLNTAASFVTNTNWQYYGGEYTMSYLSQMAGLAVQNFVSAAVGMAVLATVIRGFARRSTSGIGNFWVDLYRSLAYILLPLSIVLAVVLISQGVVQTFDGHATATTLEGAQQTIARGPAASQIAIKQLGTNGGGYYNSNSSVPFENPNGLTNFLSVLAILLIPAAQVFMFGRMVGAFRQGVSLLAAMLVMFVVGVAILLPLEQHGSQVLRSSGVDIAATSDQSGGNMSDKEVRFGIANTALWATATTSASNGSVNGGHDALTAGGGAVPTVNMFTGEVIFGGVGSGLYGMFFYVLIAVFVAGLMVGRTPEYLGKKIEAREIKFAALGALFVPTMALVLTATLDRHRLRARIRLQRHGTRLHRGPLRVHVPVEQQRQRVRGVRCDELLRRARYGCPLPRPVRAADRSASHRRFAREEEDRARLCGDVPDRRCDVHPPPRGRDRPHRGSDDLPRHSLSARSWRRSARDSSATSSARVVAVVVLTAVFGFAYPAVMTGFAQLAFENRANGSLVTRDGTVVGSRLAAQALREAPVLHPRPSATAPEYNAGATTFANLGPTSPDLAKAVQERVNAILRLEQPLQRRPDGRSHPGGRGDDVRVGDRPAYLARERRHAGTTCGGRAQPAAGDRAAPRRAVDRRALAWLPR